MVEVFAITPLFKNFSELFQPLAINLVILFLVINIGIQALKMFSDYPLEGKLYKIIFVINAIVVWPTIVFGVKQLVDCFDTFLIQDVFKIHWDGGFGAPNLANLVNSLQLMGTHITTWPLKFLNFIAFIGLIVSKQVIYWLFVIFFFFYIALGPVILAKGVLFDEIGAFFDLLSETIILLLWQTTYVTIIGLLGVEQKAGPFVITNRDNFFIQIAQVIGVVVLTFLVPSITRKFANHLGSSVIPEGLKVGASVVGFSWAAGLMGFRGGALLHGYLGTAFGRALRAGRDEHHPHIAGDHGGGGPKFGGGPELNWNLTPNQPLPPPPESFHPYPMGPASVVEFFSPNKPSGSILEINTSPGVVGSEVTNIFKEKHPIKIQSIEELGEKFKKSFQHLDIPPTPSEVPEPSPKVQVEELKPEEKAQNEIRRKALAHLVGLENSDLSEDMEKVGIDHQLRFKGTHELLIYERLISAYLRYFRYLYNFKGEFTGPSADRPTRETFEQSIPDDLKKYLHPKVSKEPTV